MSKTQIDSNGLLLAALAALLALSVLTGPFAWLGSIAGLSLVFVLLACDREGYRTGLESLAFSAVFALCLTVASAVLWRAVAASQNRPASFAGVVADDWLPLFWIGITLLFVPIDRARMSGRLQQPAYMPAAPQAIPGFMPRAAAPPPPEPMAAPMPVHVVSPPAPPPAPAPAMPAAAPSGPPPSFTRPAFSQPVVPQAPPVFTASTPIPTPTPVPPPPPPPPAAPAVAIEPEPPSLAIAPIPQGREATIYVNLIEQGLNVLRAVRAENLGHDFYRIAEEMPPGEIWQFGPNQVVRCKKKNLSSGKAMVAMEEAPRA